MPSRTPINLFVVTAMRLASRRSIPALLCIALLFAGGNAMATESRHLAADGGGTTDSNTTVADRSDETATETDDEATTAPARRATQKAKPAATSHGAGGNRSAAPRWHSFLPGMFR